MIPIQVREKDKQAISVLKPALETALYETDVELEIPTEYTGVRGFYDHNLKLNKIAYAAIEEFDLPLIRTWYKYGQYEPYEQLQPKQLDPHDHRYEDKAYVTSGQRRTVHLQDLIEFLLELDLEAVFEQEVFEFLVSNYKEWNPEPYTDAYIASTRIIQILEELHNPTPDELLPSVGNLQSEFKDASIDLRYEIESIEQFDEELHDHTSMFLRNVEDALRKIDETSTLTPENITTLRKSRRIYHEYVWPWAALTISVDRAEGPDKRVEDFRRSGRDMLRTDKDGYETHLKGWTTELEESRLALELEGYNSLDKPIPEAIHDLQRASLENT